MAGLALGRPIVTNLGRSSEEVWREDGAVALASDYSAAAFCRSIDDLFAAPDRLLELGRRAATVYQKKFSLNHSLAKLRELAEEEERSDAL